MPRTTDPKLIPDTRRSGFVKQFIGDIGLTAATEEAEVDLDPPITPDPLDPPDPPCPECPPFTSVIAAEMTPPLINVQHHTQTEAEASPTYTTVVT